ncbi:MAG: AraC family transcriptional regulator [Oscillospiraceae bacterium]|nr:AraC family transcriptional regulator [Oscillospiraceae bacterium]
MPYDIRFQNYTFKHSVDERPFTGVDSFAEHFHTSYELLYFLQGDADFVVQHEQYKLRPHNLLVIQPGAHHHLVVNSQKRYERVVLRFDAQGVPFALRGELAGLPNVFYIKDTRLSKEILRLDAYCAEIGPALAPVVLRGALSIILAYLLCGKDLEQRADYTDVQVKQITDFISDHLSEIGTVNDVCRSLHMSKTSVTQLFGERLQTPVMAYIRTQKCMRAHALLASGAPATSVYLQCGFNTYSSFYRAYSAIFGHPPSATQSDKFD